MSLKALVVLLRPHQWLKNLMLFFPPFLDGVLFNPGVLQKGLLPFGAFCLASSATYIFNDIRDAEQDLIHPRKQHRPIASGAVTVPQSIIIGLCLLVGSILLSIQQPFIFWSWLLAYFALSFTYSTVLKNLPVFDVFCIASGFVFRLFAGGAAFGVEVSDWLFLSVLLLAIFLSSGKRLSEKMMLGTLSGVHRKALKEYPDGALEGFMYISGSAVLVTYTMYAITMHRLVFTVPLCCFGLFRYLLLVKRGDSGDPTDSLVKDPVLFFVGLAWVAMVGIGTYLG
jgi:decaprenyl-phosphate phosphoribosyltransferase